MICHSRRSRLFLADPHAACRDGGNQVGVHQIGDRQLTSFAPIASNAFADCIPRRSFGARLFTPVKAELQRLGFVDAGQSHVPAHPDIQIG